MISVNRKIWKNLSRNLLKFYKNGIMNILAGMILVCFMGNDWVILYWIKKKGSSVTPDFDVVMDSRRWNKEKKVSH